MQRVYKQEELPSVVDEFLVSLENKRVIGLSGNLGAGKTTFTKQLVQELGGEGTVVSPTFVLRRDYNLDVGKLIHIDAYRLEKPEQIYQVVSKEELADQNNLIIVEWPEMSENIFDAVYLFEHVGEDTRKITKR